MAAIVQHRPMRAQIAAQFAAWKGQQTGVKNEGKVSLFSEE